ncbi:MAG: ABC transporter [Rhizobiales bacterium NRL2]|jgi:lipoprotein-releasing system ATP-binding protein|nr:MAG: ABC transporter [Rhizobiales bacterium NRL2]
MSDPALRLDGVTRTFRQGGKALEVLRGASLEVRTGEIVALVGPSGAGKSTLLQIAGLLEKPDGGDVVIAGQSAAGLNDDRRTAMRRTLLGFVYQYHHLLPEFTAAENVILPQMIAGKSRKEAAVRAAELLGQMGLAERGDHRPARLSGGEQQRVAIARALANLPAVLLADEPTGNLDPGTAGRVFDHLVEVARAAGTGVLVATHNLQLARQMDRAVLMEDGVLREAAL